MNLPDFGNEIFYTTISSISNGSGNWISFIIYVFMLFFERWIYFFQHRYTWNQKAAYLNFKSGIFKFFIEIAISGTFFIAAYIYIYENFRIFNISYLAWGWIFAILFYDLAFYINHRIAHRIGFFWSLHETHHSSQEMNLLVANRSSIFEGSGFVYPFGYFLAFLGVPPSMFLCIKFFANLWVTISHTRLIGNLGILEYILVTPSNHRVHHGKDPIYLNKNFSNVFIIWDKLFGTYQAELQEPTYGLTKNIECDTIWQIHTSGIQYLFQKIKTANRLKDKFSYLINPPEWTHGCNHQYDNK